MNVWRTRLAYTTLLATLGGAAWLGWQLLTLKMWVNVSSGLFVVLAVLAAAIFLRLARPSPFSNPDVFTGDNVERYFDALTEVARRLAAILAVTGITVVILIVAVALSGQQTEQQSPNIAEQALSELPAIERLLSAALSFLTTFLVYRIASVVRGDIGFVRLQREIVVDARKRKAQDVAARIAEQRPSWQSAGGYGRAVNS